MKIDWINWISSACPLKIERAEWYVPQLNIGGRNWYFTAATPWRIVGNEKLMLGCHDKEISEKLHVLVGLNIMGCTPMEVKPLLDPRFALSNGQFLELFSTSSLEPWLIKLPNHPLITAEPTAPDG